MTGDQYVPVRRIAHYVPVSRGFLDIFGPNPADYPRWEPPEWSMATWVEPEDVGYLTAVRRVRCRSRRRSRNPAVPPAAEHAIKENP